MCSSVESSRPVGAAAAAAAASSPRVDEVAALTNAQLLQTIRQEAKGILGVIESIKAKYLAACVACRDSKYAKLVRAGKKTGLSDVTPEMLKIVLSNASNNTERLLPDVVRVLTLAQEKLVLDKELTPFASSLAIETPFSEATYNLRILSIYDDGVSADLGEYDPSLTAAFPITPPSKKPIVYEINAVDIWELLEIPPETFVYPNAEAINEATKTRGISTYIHTSCGNDEVKKGVSLPVLTTRKEFFPPLGREVDLPYFQGWMGLQFMMADLIGIAAIDDPKANEVCKLPDSAMDSRAFDGIRVNVSHAIPKIPGDFVPVRCEIKSFPRDASPGCTEMCYFLVGIFLDATTLDDFFWAMRSQRKVDAIFKAGATYTNNLYHEANLLGELTLEYDRRLPGIVTAAACAALEEKETPKGSAAEEILLTPVKLPPPRLKKKVKGEKLPKEAAVVVSKRRALFEETKRTLPAHSIKVANRTLLEHYDILLRADASGRKISWLEAEKCLAALGFTIVSGGGSIRKFSFSGQTYFTSEFEETIDAALEDLDKEPKKVSSSSPSHGGAGGGGAAGGGAGRVEGASTSKNLHAPHRSGHDQKNEALTSSMLKSFKVLLLRAGFDVDTVYVDKGA